MDLLVVSSSSLVAGKWAPGRESLRLENVNVCSPIRSSSDINFRILQIVAFPFFPFLSFFSREFEVEFLI